MSALLIVFKNGTISEFIVTFTSSTRDGYKTGISMGDPVNCMDPLPYSVREVDLGLSKPGWIFNLVDMLVISVAVVPLTLYMCPV